MQNKLFRKVALDRLSSPEQLDQLMQVTSPRAWLAIFGLFIVLAAIVAWGILGRIPVTVDGEGILIRGGGVNNIPAEVRGQISDVYVGVGDSIQEGQVVARILTTDGNVPVTSRHTGQVLEIRRAQGNAVEIGDVLMLVEATGAAVTDLEGILYLSATDGNRVEPGMRVQISPSNVRAEEFGVMLGWVISVGQFPESRDSMLQVLEVEDLVDRFSANGAPIAVRVDLIPAETPTGYRWSTPRGPEVDLRSGTIVDATIILYRQTPISLVLPSLGTSN